MAEIKYIKGVCVSCSVWMTADSSNLPSSCESLYLHGQWQDNVFLLVVLSENFPQSHRHLLMEFCTYPEHFTWRIKPIKVLQMGWPVPFFYKLFLLTPSPKDLLFNLFSYFVLVCLVLNSSRLSAWEVPRHLMQYGYTMWDTHIRVAQLNQEHF